MANLVHIAETAVLLFFAYQAGWLVAFFARRLLLSSAKAPTVPADRLAVAKSESTAAVTAPSSAEAVLAAATAMPAPSPAAITETAPIAPPSSPRPRPVFTPVTIAPTPPPAIPTLAETSPEASFLSVLEAHDDEDFVPPKPKLPEGPAGGEEALAAVRDAIGLVEPPPPPEPEPEPQVSVAPPPAAIETPPQFDTAPLEVVPRIEVEAPQSLEDDLIAIDVPLEDDIVPAQAVAEDSFPVSPEPIVPVAAEDVEFVFKVDPGRSPELEVEAEAEPEPTPPPRQLKPASRAGEAWGGRPVPPSPTTLASVVGAALDPEAPPMPEAPPAAAPEPASPRSIERVQPPAPAQAPMAAPHPPSADNSEADAMRAIEGGWTRRPSTRPAEAAGRSVAGQAVRAAPTRPAALLEPREGGKDDLGLIEGLRPADEAALNALGIFHFDQIAAWSGPAVEWLELHQIGAGRVSGEKWVEQAEMLASIASSARAIGG